MTLSPRSRRKPGTRRDGPPIVGLVGGIASGKSTVAGLWLEERSGELVDADSIARRVVARPSTQKKLAERFPRAFSSDGKLDRAKLARIAFSSDRRREELEAITHPPIRRAIETALAGIKGEYALLDAPLLQETGLDAICRYVVYVSVPARIRRRRAGRDRGWTEDEHRTRESHQWSCRRKRARADFVIDNSRSLTVTRRDVRRALTAIEKAAPRPGRSRSRTATRN